MATLMSWHNSEGCKGRCDARCHNAKNPHCDCMCGGRYHGGARDGTLAERVDQYGEEVLEGARKRAEAEGKTFEALACADMLEAVRTRRAWRKRNKATTVKVEPQTPALFPELMEV